MRPPKTRLELLAKLRNRLDSGVYSPGTRLPGENELCLEFRVSRETLRRALEMLEDEKRIHREKNRGVLVNEDTFSREDRRLYFLIPCPDYFQDSGFSTYRTASGLLSGCLRESHLLNFSVATLSLSQTNRRDDIDWNSIGRIPNGGRVMFFGNWFENIFDFLYEKHCRVMMMHNIWYKPLDEYPEHDGYHHWANGFFDIRSIYERLTSRLYREGCRRIEIASAYLDCKDSPIRAGAEDAAKTRTDGEIRYLDLGKSSHDLKDLQKQISETYGKHPFDGLIVNLPETFLLDFQKTLNENLGLPNSVRIYTAEKNNLNHQLKEPIPCCTFDYINAGAIGARYLFTQTYENKRFIFPPAFLNLDNPEDERCPAR